MALLQGGLRNVPVAASSMEFGKPSNVLVTLHDGKPVPKIIDFGLARATHQQLTDKTLFTALAQMVGTPIYMSPEQAEMSSLDIDNDILTVLLSRPVRRHGVIGRPNFCKDIVRRLLFKHLLLGFCLRRLTTRSDWPARPARATAASQRRKLLE